MKITEDSSDSDRNKYSGYGICFDEASDFSLANIVNGINVIIFGADMSLSSHERSRANEIYVLGKDIIQVTTVGPTALSGRTSKGTRIYAENCTDILLQNQIKSSRYLYTTMVIIVIGLLMEVKN